MGVGIEIGQYLAQKAQGLPAALRAYDHAEVYVGQPDAKGPHGYTCSAYPNNGKGGLTGKRPLPCPPSQLPGAVWSSGIIKLTAKQRFGIITWCMDHPCVSYSWADYGAVAAHALGINMPGLRSYIQASKSLMCSYYTDSAYNQGGGVHLFTDGRWEGYVTPGDLADLLLVKAGPMGVH
jgi:hypothetical protein